VKLKSLEDIKHGERILRVLSTPCTFNDVVTRSSLDKVTTQKVISSLHKHGYIMKDDRDLWVSIGDVHVQETRIS
jgi:DNA-binding IclR family transcriptional regulator